MKRSKANHQTENLSHINEAAINEYCELLDIKPHFVVNLLFVSTPYGNWYMDLTTFPIKLFHGNSVADLYNLGRTKFKSAYHDQQRSFNNCYDALRYIHDHDFNKVKREIAQHKDRNIFGALDKDKK